MRPERPEETRADVARRRLAQLAASFDAQLPEETEAPVPERRLDRRHVPVLATVAVAASVLLGWWLLAGRPQATAPAEPLAFSSSTPASASASPAELVVDVVGKVERPGIVTVPPGSRVHEAIEAAGGLVGRPDTTSLNMARVLADGEQLLVGIEPAAGAASGAATTPGASGGKVDLNRATAEQLDALPGVGPVTAGAILDWRTENGRFASVDDLLDVSGIGEATLAKLRDLVTV